MSEIQIINETDHPFREKEMHQEIIKMIVFLENHFQEKTSWINYCFMSTDKIQSLNCDFLQIDKPTDVLSFPDEDELPKIAGDIGLCPDLIFEDAKTDGLSQGMYLAEVMLHGTLHLFGLEHDYSDNDLKRVYQLHKELLDKMKLNPRGFHV